MELRVCESHVGFRRLRDGRLVLRSRALESAVPHGDLLGSRFGERQCGACRFDLLVDRIGARLRDRIRGTRLIGFLWRNTAAAKHRFVAVECHLRVCDVRDSLIPACDRTAQRGLGLVNLVGGLLLLISERGLALLNLFCGPFLAAREERAIGGELPRRKHGKQLSLVNRVTLLDEELGDLSTDLRADDDIVGRDDAGEREAVRRSHVEVGTDQDEDRDSADHCQPLSGTG